MFEIGHGEFVVALLMTRSNRVSISGAAQGRCRAKDFPEVRREELILQTTKDACLVASISST
jgi:hypothetical protein